jgi:DNA-binding response OmpR family regulator
VHILVVDDDPKFRSYVSRGLTESGFPCTTAPDGRAGIELLRSSAADAFDLVLLDVMMPEKSGFELLSELRGAGRDTPVIFVTARDAVLDRVRGLQLGADDYIVKPFAFDELLARIEAVVRRRYGWTTLVHGDLELDLVRRLVRRAGRAIDLSPREFDLLRAMIARRGSTATRAELLREVWGIEFDPETNVVDVHVGRLRRKLDRRGSPLIETVRGSGYRVVEAGDLGPEGR